MSNYRAIRASDIKIAKQGDGLGYTVKLDGNVEADDLTKAQASKLKRDILRREKSREKVNPAVSVKSVRVKNFTGTIAQMPNGQVKVVGKAKGGRRVNPARKSYRLDYKDVGRRRGWAVFNGEGSRLTTYGTKAAATSAAKQYRAEAKMR